MSLYSDPRWSDAAGTMIDVTMDHPEHGPIPRTVRQGEPLFDEAVGGAFGAIAPFEPKSLDARALRLTIVGIADHIVIFATRSRRASILSYGLRLSTRQSRTPEEEADLLRIVELDQWEEQIIATRERLIAAGDLESARRDETWPAPPAWLTAEWLQGF